MANAETEGGALECGASEGMTLDPQKTSKTKVVGNSYRENEEARDEGAGILKANDFL